MKNKNIAKYERMMPMKRSLTTSTITSRDPRGIKFMQNCAAAYDKACLDGDHAQQLNEDKKFWREFTLLLEKHSQPDPRFQLVNTFEITVPQGYDHATRLDTFRKEHGQEFAYFNPNLTDANFGKATTKLVPGRKLKVKVFQIKATVSSDDCLAHLESQKAILVGAQGASLAYEQAHDELPVDRWSISFDEKEAFWKDAAGYRRVPLVRRDSDGDFEFILGSFEGDWSGDDCLLCFCDLEPQSSGA